MLGMEARIGHGYDLHRLEELGGNDVTMKVGGVRVPCAVRPCSHSDGDAVMHAVTDALLSAIGEPDIGQLFPDTELENENRDSADFLAEAMSRVNEGGWAIGNVDITVICDNPKIGPHREQICENLRKLIVAPVNIKGKTHEGIGDDKAIEVHAVALVQRGSHT